MGFNAQLLDFRQDRQLESNIDHLPQNSMIYYSTRNSKKTKKNRSSTSPNVSGFYHLMTWELKSTISQLAQCTNVNVKHLGPSDGKSSKTQLVSSPRHLKMLEIHKSVFCHII